MKFNIDAVDLGNFEAWPYRKTTYGDEAVVDNAGDLIETVWGEYGYVEIMTYSLFCRKLTEDYKSGLESETEEEFDNNYFHVNHSNHRRNLTQEFPGRIDYNDNVIVGHGGGPFLGQKGEVLDVRKEENNEGEFVNKLVIRVTGFPSIVVEEKYCHKIKEFVREKVSEVWKVGDKLTVRSTRSKFDGRVGHILQISSKRLEVKDIETKLTFCVDAKWCRDEMGNRRVVNN